MSKIWCVFFLSVIWSLNAFAVEGKFQEAMAFPPILEDLKSIFTKSDSNAASPQSSGTPSTPKGPATPVTPSQTTAAPVAPAETPASAPAPTAETPAAAPAAPAPEPAKDSSKVTKSSSNTADKDKKDDKKSEKPKPLPTITNLKDIAQQLKISLYKGKKFNRRVKVAVLDNGFYGWQAEVGRIIPTEDYYHPGPKSAADSIESKAFHGLYMAKLISDLVKASGAEADFEIHLFNTFGYTKFSSAVDTVIKDRFDLVLYSQVWEYGGNGDGKGFINAVVDRATAAGIVWLNAAGNFGRLTKVAPVETENDWVVFKDKKGKKTDGVKIFCRTRGKDKCNLRLFMSWNDSKDDPDTGTDKDLDLFLYNSKKEQIKSSERHQKLAKDTGNDQNSTIPREFIEMDLKPGVYTAKVKNISKNFSPDRDKLKFTVSGFLVDIEDPSTDETLLPPAENPTVIAVGASDDVQSSRSKSLKIPKVYLHSITRHKDGSTLFSTSNATAMAAAVSVLEMGTTGNFQRDAVLNKLVSISRTADQDVNVGAPPMRHRAPPRRRAPVHGPGYEYDLDEGPYPYDGYYYGAEPYAPGYGMGGGVMPVGGGAIVGGGCRPPRLPIMYPEAAWVLDLGGVVTIGPGGRPVIFLNPMVADEFGLRSNMPYQRVFITPQGPAYLSPGEFYGLPPTFYEIIASPVPPAVPCR